MQLTPARLRYPARRRPVQVSRWRLLKGRLLTSFPGRIGKIDCAFLGGSRNLAETLTLLAEEGTRSIVVNAVLLETACLAIETMKRLGIFSDALHLQVSRSYELTKRTMFKPINPVYIIHGENTC